MCTSAQTASLRVTDVHPMRRHRPEERDMNVDELQEKTPEESEECPSLDENPIKSILFNSRFRAESDGSEQF